ncbi:hypothetical protein BWI17_09590 [Betaproteobacteria bacterium GR16-43]|nr:hypothetical protein BWI17_09590 [Betaproteobacteria bacterium GR16-43]
MVFQTAVAFGADTLVSVTEARRKLSSDLQQALVANSVAGVNWARESSSGRLVKVLVMAQPGIDPDLVDIRRAITAANGTVYYRYISVPGVAAMIPASRVLDIARRADVESLSPNRMTARTKSLLEKSTGASETRSTGGSGGLDGTGVGIAFLDSGIMASHKAFAGTSGGSRVKKSVDLLKINEGALLGTLDWKGGYDFSRNIRPGSDTLNQLESIMDSANATFADRQGHGTMVASLAAGKSVSGSSTGDSNGIAPGASLLDVRVLDENGVGDIGDALAGIDWVILHKNDYNIRVLNISLAADSTETYRTDPLCRAVRNAVAAGITVVVAAGNYGQDANGREVYGTISSPGNEPSAITVGADNPHASDTRGDDSVNNFSSRGPTRGGYVDANNVRHPDNVLKPDLIAPGNRLPAALATDVLGLTVGKLGVQYPQLILQRGLNTGLIQVSGTSFSAPVVSGTVALMLQANPGLTPPLVKAILQYSAEPLPGYNLLQQGAGLVNVPGSIAVARALSTSINTRAATGQLRVGDSILAPGATLPTPSSTIEGRTFQWSRFAYLGGNHIFTGDDLLKKFQGVYDPQVSWVSGRATYTDLEKFSGTSVISGFDENTPRRLSLVSKGVKVLSKSLGGSSSRNNTGVFILTRVLAEGIAQGLGIIVSEGIDFTDGIIVSEGIDFTDGIIVSEGIIVNEGVIVSEGVIISEGVIVSEAGALRVRISTATIYGEP